MGPSFLDGKIRPWQEVKESNGSRVGIRGEKPPWVDEPLETFSERYGEEGL